MEDPFAMFTLALFVIAGFINTVHGTWGVTADASQAVYGNNATLQCNYQGGTGVILANLFIYNKDKSTTFLNYLIGANAVFGDPSKLDSRYSYNSTTNIMTISSVECVDDVEFVCEVTANVETFSDIQKKESRAAFDVQVRPSPPEAMTTVPASLKEGLKDGDSLAATCIANIGRPGSGRIKWVIYRDGVEEQVSDGDERVAPSEVSPASGEQSCTVRKKSTLTLNNLTHLDQKLVVTCFVMSDDFPSNPKVCNSTTDSLCQQSETIYIYYPVKELQVSREPQSDLVEGSSVTLKCTAKGFPEPTYQWTKVETNATLSASMNGKYSQLVLNNLDIDRDSGNYRCTAMNELKGETYNVSNDVHVLVVKTPPSTTASPTTDPGKASTQKTTKDPEDASPTTVQPDLETTKSVINHNFDCDITSLSVHVPVEKAPNSKLTLKDPSCELVSDGTHYVLHFKFDECGTSVSYFKDYIHITNTILVHKDFGPISLPIEFEADYNIPIKCSLKRETFIEGSFQTVTRPPVIEVDDGIIPDINDMHYELREFKTAAYEEEITEYPVKIPINKEVYFELSVNDPKPDIGIEIQSCVATPSEDPEDQVAFELIKNGCPATLAANNMASSTATKRRFRVQAFHFSGSINNHNTVYIHCQVKLCLPLVCSKPKCTERRRRRSLKRTKSRRSKVNGSHVYVSYGPLIRA